MPLHSFAALRYKRRRNYFVGTSTFLQCLDQILCQPENNRLEICIVGPRDHSFSQCSACLYVVCGMPVQRWPQTFQERVLCRQLLRLLLRTPAQRQAHRPSHCSAIQTTSSSLGWMLLPNWTIFSRLPSARGPRTRCCASATLSSDIPTMAAVLPVRPSRIWDTRTSISLQFSFART